MRKSQQHPDLAHQIIPGSACVSSFGASSLAGGAGASSAWGSDGAGSLDGALSTFSAGAAEFVCNWIFKKVEQVFTGFLGGLWSSSLGLFNNLDLGGGLIRLRSGR